MKTQVKPSFSDIVQLVRKHYKEEFHIEVGYAAAAKLVDEAIEPQVLQQINQARLEEIEGLRGTDILGTFNRMSNHVSYVGKRKMELESKLQALQTKEKPDVS